jgi:deoxyribodipyrimidine photo-lyase
MVPAERVTAVNAAPLRPDGEFVLYWMIAHRRPHWNHALQRAVERARELGRPLVVLEYVRSGHVFSCDRLHRLMLQGMIANRTAFARSTAHYLPYVELRSGTGAAVLRGLLTRACCVVTDEFPCYLHPRMVANLGTESPVLVEAVDANGLLPLRATTAAHGRAVDFRRTLQRSLAPHLGRFPAADPLARVRLPRLTDGTLPVASDLDGLLAGGIANLPIDHTVGAVTVDGGWKAARSRLDGFLADQLDRYADERSVLIGGAASGLSVYLHLGHISVHEVVQAVWDRSDWTPERLGSGARGAKDGWWGLPAAAESFLDEIVTWRELGHHYCFHRPDHTEYTSLPAWALKTLDEHRADRRAHLYTREQFERGETHDELWNAAQRQLRESGIIHNYLRMLWGKKVIEWSATPEEAWSTLDHLNNRWAIDGCNPNSWSGISWCFGRFDRPWAPMRPIFGSIRWMSSDNTKKKMNVKPYMAQWGKTGQGTWMTTADS